MHRNVLLDDRGGIVLGNNVSISDYANIYSHTHSIVDQKDVTNATTVIEDGVRITYHATVLAGVHVHEQGMVGAMAVATKDVRPYHVYVGIPAKSVRVKPNAPQAATVLRTSSDRGQDPTAAQARAVSDTRITSSTGPASPAARSSTTSRSDARSPGKPKRDERVVDRRATRRAGARRR